MRADTKDDSKQSGHGETDAKLREVTSARPLHTERFIFGLTAVADARGPRSTLVPRVVDFAPVWTRNLDDLPLADL